MSLSQMLRPRFEEFAARSATALFLVGAFLLSVYVLVEPVAAPAFARPLSLSLLAALLAAAAVALLTPPAWLTRVGAWPALPLAGVVAIGWLAFVFPDQLDVAHALFGLPVLFAGSQLRPPIAIAVTGLAIGLDTAALLAVEPADEALVDALFVGAILTVTTVMLVLIMNRTEQLVTALHRQAAVDGLTGLVTRRVLDEALTSALSAAAVHEGSALVLADIDNFKTINDTHGHPVGDDALVHLAGVLRRHVRARDAVLSRLGGDELAVLLPGCSAETAAERAGELVAAVRDTPFELPDGRLCSLTISVGVAHAPSHATGLRALYTAADTALYAAKRLGRNQAVLAEAGLDPAIG